jgi:hypothetical protein
MASLNQLVSEIAHAVGEPNNIPLRRNIRYAIIHTRNELIRKSYENHHFVDKGLNQRFRVDIISVPDGDLCNSVGLSLPVVKRTRNKVPKPVRLVNGLPFQSVRTAGTNSNEIAFAKEGTAKFYHHLAGFCNQPVYDYINGYIYFFGNTEWFSWIGAIIIESHFEQPHLIPEETFEYKKDVAGEIDDESKFDDDEFLLPEDMIGAIKDIIFKRNLLDVPRETNEVPMENIVK